jgi:hypothetical protein
MEMIHRPEGWIVSYDVESERNRRQLRRILDGVGHRILFSTYAVDDLSGEALAELVTRLREWVGPTDSIVGDHHCPACAPLAIGQPQDTVDRCRIA